MGYGEAPWVFKGRALYQLQVVKSEEARRHIPAEFKLVELFGYTLGGFYLARYDDSPAGQFDELVALAGLVWNPPTSCAWAARVYVNSRPARDHGLRSVGLPSRLAAFNAAPPTQDGPLPPPHWWWQRRRPAASDTFSPTGLSAGASSSAQQGAFGPDLSVMSLERRSAKQPVCSFELPEARAPGAWPGPRICLTLPSFSGGTPDHPALIQYACDLVTNVRFVQPAVVAAPEESRLEQTGRPQSEAIARVLEGRPLLCMAFDDMVMTVNKPISLDLRAGHRRLRLPAVPA